MKNVQDVQRKVRKVRKWAFLAEMIGEGDDLGPAIQGVNLKGVLLVNPNEACKYSTEDLSNIVRQEFRVAHELRTNVSGFR